MSSSTDPRDVHLASSRMPRRVLLRQIATLGLSSAIAGCSWSGPTPVQRVRRIGFLSGNASRSWPHQSAILGQALSDLGYTHGRDITIHALFAENDLARLPDLVAELVALPVDVFVTMATAASLAAKSATKSIPIVFANVTAPVGDGVVANIAHPERNVTGVTTHSSELSAKRLEWLKEVVPALRRVAMFWNANFTGVSQGGRQDTIDAARAMGIDLESHPVHDPAELDRELGRLAESRPDAILTTAGFNVVSRDERQVPEAAARLGLPQIYSEASPVRVGGGLMAVGPDYDAILRRVAGMVDKIFKGARPADVPVEFATQFDWVVNLTMAARLGLTIPDSVRRQANEIIQ